MSRERGGGSWRGGGGREGNECAAKCVRVFSWRLSVAGLVATDCISTLMLVASTCVESRFRVSRH